MKKTLRILFLSVLMVMTLCVTAGAVEKNGYDVTFAKTEDGYLAAALAVPGTACEDGYCVTIYNAADPTVYYDFYYDASLEWPCELMTTKAAVYDTVRVAQGANTWFEDENAVVLAQWTLEVPVVVETGFALDGTITLEQGEVFDDFVSFNILGADSTLCYIIEEPGNWDVVAHFPSEVPNAEEYTLWFAVDSGAASFLLYGCDITLSDSKCTMRVSAPVTLALKGEQPTASGYGVELSVWNTIFFAAPVVPEGTDEDQMYDIYLYSSATGNEFGGTEFYLGGGVMPYKVADTYDRAKLLKSDTGELLADVELAKPVITANSLTAPSGITVTRVEASSTQDTYTVTGIDLSKYGYEISDNGQGGTNCDEETFTIGKDYFGDMTIAYVKIFSAVEKSDGFYLDQSPYVTVAVNGGKTEETATVSGTVSGGQGASVTVGGESVQVNADGSFTVSAEGTFDVVISKGGCLTYTIKGVTASENVDLGEVVMVAGDVNEDGKINIADMGVFRQEFGKTGDTIGNAYTDVNEDGKVNIADMGIFRQNFGKTAEKDCTVEYTA